MLEATKKIFVGGMLCGFGTLVLIMLMMNMSELVFGPSESANRLMLYLTKGQSVAVVLLAVSVVWLKKAGILKLLK
jgi:hypothetical protein